MKSFMQAFSATAAVLLGAGISALAFPPTFPITYQGQLKQAGNPVDANVSMTFRVFSAATGGAQLGSQTMTVPVNDGLFTVTLNDAGQFAPFDGSSRWLEIVAAGTTLSPRQPITPTPYAWYAYAAAPGHSLDAADGTPTNAVYVD